MRPTISASATSPPPATIPMRPATCSERSAGTSNIWPAPAAATRLARFPNGRAPIRWPATGSSARPDGGGDRDRRRRAAGARGALSERGRRAALRRRSGPGLRRGPPLRPPGDADRLRGAAGLHPHQQPAGDPDRGTGRASRRVRRRADAARRARRLCGRADPGRCCAGLRPRPVPAEAVRINGLPALLLPVLVQTEQGAVELSIAAYDGGDGGAYHFVMVAPPADALARGDRRAVRIVPAALGRGGAEPEAADDPDRPGRAGPGVRRAFAAADGERSSARPFPDAQRPLARSRR